MIDETRLRELEEDFGIADLREILDAFLAEAEAAVIQLGGMAAGGAADARRVQLHFLKGCARNVGASRLGDLCERLESAAASFSVSEHQQLQSEFRILRDYFSDQPWRDAG